MSARMFVRCAACRRRVRLGNVAQTTPRHERKRRRRGAAFQCLFCLKYFCERCGRKHFE